MLTLHVDELPWNFVIRRVETIVCNRITHMAYFWSRDNKTSHYSSLKVMFLEIKTNIKLMLFLIFTICYYSTYLLLLYVIICCLLHIFIWYTLWYFCWGSFWVVSSEIIQYWLLDHFRKILFVHIFFLQINHLQNQEYKIFIPHVYLCIVTFLLRLDDWLLQNIYNLWKIK